MIKIYSKHFSGRQGSPKLIGGITKGITQLLRIILKYHTFNQLNTINFKSYCAIAAAFAAQGAFYNHQLKAGRRARKDCLGLDGELGGKGDLIICDKRVYPRLVLYHIANSYKRLDFQNMTGRRKHGQGCVSEITKIMKNFMHQLQHIHLHLAIVYSPSDKAGH